jgi:hypothetical protein
MRQRRTTDGRTEHGVIDGGTGQFRFAHRAFHAVALPNGEIQATADINAGR